MNSSYLRRSNKLLYLIGIFFSFSVNSLKIFPLNAIELKYFGRPSFLNRISFVLEKTPSAATNRSNFSVFIKSIFGNIFLYYFDTILYI